MHESKPPNGGFYRACENAGISLPYIFRYMYNYTQRGNDMSAEKYVGDKQFYSDVCRLAIPSMLQQLLSSAMGMVDTMMVSAIGMVSPVGVASQLGNICSCISFGVMEGTGIYASQFYGADDRNNLQRTFGLSIILSLIVGFAFFGLIAIWCVPVIEFYARDPEVIRYAKIYLDLVKYSFPLNTCALAFNYFYRCIHKTNVSMWISTTSMATNAIVNYILIYGKLGFSPMGVAGAAWGTIASQVVALGLYYGYSVISKAAFIGSPRIMFDISRDFFNKVMVRTYPTIANETLFGFGTSLYIKAYGLLGTKVTDSYYVANTITNMFFSVCNGLSVSGSMLLGAELGKGDVRKATMESRWFLYLGFALAVFTGTIVIGVSQPLVSLFGLTNPEIIAMSVALVRVSAFRIALRMIVVVIFSSLRAGGDSKMLMVLDCGIVWLVGIPLIYGMISLLHMQNFPLIYFLAQFELVARIIIGMRRFNSNRWAVNLTGEIATAQN